jgi:hypothetical protein
MSEKQRQTHAHRHTGGIKQPLYKEETAENVWMKIKGPEDKAN